MSDFRSDNVSGVSKEVMDSILAANLETDSAYGDDKHTLKLVKRMSSLFERNVKVYPVSTGTAANTLSFACSVPPYGAIFCEREAHVAVDECNGPEFYTGGAKVVGLLGDQGKIAPGVFAAAADGIAPHGYHNPQPAAVSLAQATEVGTVYTPEEINNISSIAHDRNMIVHIDGARISNAVVHLGCSWADVTWRAGVDLLSLGATKNGVLAAEAIVSFREDLCGDLPFFRKRGGHLLSKMRFLSAQLNAYLDNDLWKHNAKHANNMALRLAEGLKNIDGAEIMYPVEANGVFVRLPRVVVQQLYKDGFQFYSWGNPKMDIYRLMTAFDTTASSVDNLIDAAQKIFNAWG